jgi:hypothetical protein
LLNYFIKFILIVFEKLPEDILRMYKPLANPFASNVNECEPALITFSNNVATFSPRELKMVTFTNSSFGILKFIVVVGLNGLG